MNNGYLDFGKKSGCPYDTNSCQNGFNLYGWVKFLSYPSMCSQYGVIVSTDQFNIHILGNGHLAVYVWMENDREWYAETVQPVILNVYYPIVMQYYHNSETKEGSIQLIMQDQLSAIQNCSRLVK
uniref:Uncharacterized protein n=1 Tax=Romanomermis culicivorax TaxID=13658 RepID=A0A915KA61_ROMCU